MSYAPHVHSRRIFAFACALVCCLAPRASAESRASGVWWNATKTVQVEITEGDNGVSGHVVWLREPLDAEGHAKRDVNNPDPALRGRPMLGLEVLSGLRPHHKRDDVWFGGTAYDANRGKAYRCTVRIDEADRVYVRGYVGIPLLGRTEWWTRVSDRELAATSRPRPASTATAEAPAPAPPAVSALPPSAAPATGAGG